MKKRAVCLLALLLLLLSACPLSSAETAQGGRLRLLFTTDIHSNDVPHKTLENGEVESVGGFARLSAAISANYLEGDTLLLDSGDFSMGTLYQTFTVPDALELTLMGELGYDAIALGNHDFEAGEQELRDELALARKNGCESAILCANLVEGTDTASTDQNANPLNPEGVQNYTVIERGGVRAGLFAIMGADAIQYTPVRELSFAEPIKSAAAVVKKLREEEKVDIVIMLSHAGYLSDGSFTEDAEIARAVPGIDVILSGHEHVPMPEIVYEGSTMIVGAGTAIENLGLLDLAFSDGGWRGEYKLIPITDDWEADPAIKATLDGCTERLNAEYLARYGVDKKFDETFAYSPYSFPGGDVMIQKCDNYPLGALMTDAYLDTLKKNGCGDAEVAIIPTGMVRSGLYEGDVTVMDVYNVLGYGISPLDGSAGAPMVGFYLTASELYDACETSISLSPLINSAQLMFGGLRYTYSDLRPILDKVYSVELLGSDGEYHALSRSDKTLHKVVCSWTTMKNVALVKSSSYGLLSIEPKDENGAVLDTAEAQTGRVLRGANGRELKEWYALYSYIASMPENADGLSVIEAKYGEPAGFMLERDGGVSTFFASPSRAALLIGAAALLLILLVISIIVLTVRRRRKKAAAGGGKNKGPWSGRSRPAGLERDTQ